MMSLHPKHRDGPTTLPVAPLVYAVTREAVCDEILEALDSLMVAQGTGIYDIFETGGVRLAKRLVCAIRDNKAFVLDGETIVEGK